jgi:hypothetical protein
MTEAEWLACTDPTRMLQFPGEKTSPRKLRLFACACCRRAWHLLTDGRCQEAVEVSERFADGAADEHERHAAERAVTKMLNNHFGGRDEIAAVRAADMAVAPPLPIPQLLYFVRGAAEDAADAVRYEAFRQAMAAGGRKIAPNVGAGERAAQAALLGDIIGKPFRPVAVDAAWPLWNGWTVAKLARAIYDERAFDRLPILADALEDAGCHETGILAHCRGTGEHVRGCWAVDLLLGKT